jgi:hypothetical protein
MSPGTATAVEYPANVFSVRDEGSGRESETLFALGTVEEYQRTAVLPQMGRGPSNAETGASMLELAQVWLGLADNAERRVPSQCLDVWRPTASRRS